MPRYPSPASSTANKSITTRDVLAFISVCASVPSWLLYSYSEKLGFGRDGFSNTLAKYEPQGWFTRLFKSFSWYGSDDDEGDDFQTFKGFTTAAEKLTIEEVEKAYRLWRPICDSRVSSVTIPVDIQYEVMCAAITYLHDDTLPKFRINKKTVQAWDDWSALTIDLVNALFRDPKWVAFARQLPVPVAIHQLGKFEHDLNFYGIELSPPELREYILDSLDGSSRSDLQDYFTFWSDFVVNGRPQEVLAKMSADGKYSQIVRAVQSMSEQKPPKEAVELMRKALKELGNGKRSFDNWFLDWLYGIALYRDKDNPDSLRKMQTLARTKKLQEDSARSAFWILTACGSLTPVTPRCLDKHFSELTPSWNEDNGSYSLPYLNTKHLLLLRLTANHFKLRTMTESHLGTRIQSLLLRNSILALETANELGDTDTVLALEKRTGLKPLLPAFVVKPDWEIALDRLMSSERTKKIRGNLKAAGQTHSRVLYQLSLDPWKITLKQQKSKGNGWTKGVELSFNAFKNGVEGMTEQDRIVAACLRPQLGYASRWEFPFASTMLALVGNPNVVDAKTGEHLEIEKVPLQISVKKASGKGWQFAHNLDSDFDFTFGQISVQRSGPGRLIVIEPTADELFMIQETKEIVFPEEAQQKLTTYLESLSRSTPVMSNLLKEASNLKKLKGENRITFRIQPTANAMYSISATVRPASEANIFCEPGKGLDAIAANIKGQTLQIVRNLKAERDNYACLSQALATFEQNLENENNWCVDTLQCLEFLEVLREHTKEAIVEWPEGVKFSVTKAKINPENLKLSVMRMGNWLEVEGKIRLDAKTYLSVADLLEKLRNSQGNFIRLNDKEYVALTASLKKQIEQLDNFSSKDRKGNIRVSVFNSGLIENLEKEGVAVDADQSFRDMLQRIQKASRFNPVVPNALRAELRAYQVEGFEWLSRLASWGAGALLADDMGLGKTLQTIALLLDRSAQGPSLVVMPAAVLFNWAEELHRFAPTLKVKIFNSADREKLVREAVAGDIILTTYGVMTSEIDQLKTREWTTVVLDEAHAIKNRDTKMSKAAMQLKSSARVLLTGTPLQNHLSEIWNLFEFANPGLLSNFTDFSERFILPIEKSQNRDRQRLLKRLISPFILRRTKAEVLDELPEKTEITLRVALSDEERALYENLRERASQQLESGEINPIEALSELTRLRQAACHPALINKSLKIASSKTAAFIGLVEELMQSNHRALVFSQFTSHLALIRAELETKGIRYLYLDGSTPAAQRQKLVDQFQHGDIPLFLISLKAGGTGLNLTAADYVIHLDPWWNPAVEDQASDRSYRIGQDNPVTVYRLIAENTIEEKILRLHATKKSLADALLDGSNMSNRLSKEEILKLLASA